jgi:hypothetical protein
MFRSTIQNVGTIPAHNLVWKAVGKVNGNPIPRQQVYEDDPLTTVLFPHVQSWFDGFVSAEVYDGVMVGTARLEMDIGVTYFGTSKNERAYSYEERRRYDPGSNSFVVKHAHAT